MKHNKRFQAFVGACVLAVILCVVTPLNTMISEKSTAKRLRVPQPAQQPLPKRYKSKPIWVKTSDNIRMELPEWQIDQMKAVQHKGAGTQYHWVDAPMITSDELELVQKALNVFDNLEKFRKFYADLSEAQKGTLINSAAKLEMQGLTSLLMAYTFPMDVQGQIGAGVMQEKGMIASLVKYLQPDNFKIALKEAKDNVLPWCVAFSPNGDYILSGGACGVGPDDNQYSREGTFLGLWDAKTGKEIKNFKEVRGPVSCIAFSPDGKKIVAGSRYDDKNFILWDITDLNKITHTVLTGHNSGGFHIGMLCVAYSPDGNYIVSGSYGNENNLILWDGKTGEKIKSLEGHNNSVACVAFSTDSAYIISGSYGKKNNLILWNSETGEKIKVLEGPQTSINCVAFSPNGNYIVSGSNEHYNSLILWDGRIGEKVKIFEGISNAINCVAFSPDSNHIISGLNGPKNNLFLWDVSPITNKMSYLFLSLKNFSHGVLPEDVLQKIRQNLVELSKLNIIPQELKGHSNNPGGTSAGILCVAFSPDGNYLISGSVGKQDNLILWNGRTGQQVKNIEVGGTEVRCVAVSPDSSSVVCGGSFNLVLFNKIFNQPALNYIATQLNITQARFLYRLYLSKINNTPVVLDKNDPDYQIYLSLPQDVQQLIKTYLPFEESSIFVEKSKKEQLIAIEKQIQEKMKEYRLKFKKMAATTADKMKTLKILMKDFDKNSIDYKACDRLLHEIELEAAFEV